LRNGVHTHKRFQALALLRQGLGVREVARRVGVSHSTVIRWRREQAIYPFEARRPLAAIAAGALQLAPESDLAGPVADDDAYEEAPASDPLIDALANIGAALGVVEPQPAPLTPRHGPTRRGGWVMLASGEPVWREP
jgi:transcriptional regulator with XRE-family HTH domain